MPPVAGKDKETGSGEPKQRRRPGRVPVSCAECRRLKLRCDRKVPCETCVKRGCAAICPEGSLTTGKSGRLALADAEELHRKIEHLRARSAALEDALKSLQAAVCDEPHPLLAEDTQRSNSDSSSSPPDGPLLSREDEEFLDSFGTLTLGLRGEARFFGQTSRSEYLIHAPSLTTACSKLSYPHLSPELVGEAMVDLEVVCDNLCVRDEIRNLMPSLSQACRMCEIFLERGRYMWCPIPREQLFDEIMGSVYRSGTQACNLASTHAFSLLFTIFSLATLFDLDQPPYSVEAQEYHLLARVCLRFAPPVSDTTLIAVQTMIYMAQYLELSDAEPAHSASHKSWLLIGTAVKLGHSIGLHVNSSRWKLDEEASQRRCRVFWQLFFQDTWLSFGFGRPPSMSLAFIDCEFPKDPEEQVTNEGHKNWGFHHWTWQYTKLLHNIITTIFGAKSPAYSTMLEFDRKIRDFPIPYVFRPKCGQVESPSPTLELFMQRFFILSSKESSLLSLHRPFFAQALNEQPQDLLRHRYGPSVMAIYRSAWRCIEGANQLYKTSPALASRLGIIWSQCLAGGIVMCLLITRASSSTLAGSSLHELDNLIELFEKASETCPIANNNLDVVRKLWRQGHETMNKTQPQGNPELSTKELDRLGGKTHLISPAESSNSSSVPTPPYDPSSNMTLPVPADFIHPTIMQDLRAFDGVDATFDFDQFNFDLPTDLQSHASQVAPDVIDEMFRSQPAFANYPEVETVPAPGLPVLDATWQSFVEQLGF
ncbi:fungal-specific transcription factor domain-containing protein [Amylocystis lapponica]|nr:fungal-specific transcription factor domain-containing protein [Amylocystis lapponica]